MQVETNDTSTMLVENLEEKKYVNLNSISSPPRSLFLIFFRRDCELTVDDLSLLCDLFYLPFEHGGQGLQLLQEFNWLKSNAHLVVSPKQIQDKSNPEVCHLFYYLVRNIVVHV